MNGDIAHIIEAGLPVLQPEIGGQSIIALLGGHAVAFAAGQVPEAAALYHIAAQGVQHTVTVLDEVGVGVGIQTQGCQSYHHLGAGLTVGVGIPAGVQGIEATIVLLQLGQNLEGLIHPGPDLLLGLIVRGQSLNGHACHIRVCNLAADGPAAVRQLPGQNGVNELLPGHRVCAGGCGGDLVVVGIQGDQSPDGAVDSLLLHKLHVRQALEQIVAAHVGHILAHGREGQDQPGVIRRLAAVEAALPVDFLFT